MYSQYITIEDDSVNMLIASFRSGRGWYLEPIMRLSLQICEIQIMIGYEHCQLKIRNTWGREPACATTQ